MSLNEPAGRMRLDSTAVRHRFKLYECQLVLQEESKDIPAEQ